MIPPQRIVVVGAGITGLATAYSLLTTTTQPIDVVVLESSSRIGGLIRSSPFGGLNAVDEGADAFLSRVPWASTLARDVGLAASLTSPRAVGAHVWHNGLHPIPTDLMLGVPANIKSFATSGLFSSRGKARAALEPLLPRTTDTKDCIGYVVRKRFGREIQELLVDPLVGSIYAADTDNFSLESVPQIAALMNQRSMLLAARTARSKTPPTGPIFESPIGGMESLVTAVAKRIQELGARIILDSAVTQIEKSKDSTYVVHCTNGTHSADAIVLASPARHTAPLLSLLDPIASQHLSKWSHASVVMLTLAVPRSQWKHSLTSAGYLVPKPDQRWVTAVSFGSNKWAHWKTPDDAMIVRASVGRDGVDTQSLTDDAIINLTLADLKHHLDIDVVAQETRITRWPESFPQYRPYHFARLAEIEASLALTAPHVHLAGASYRGIGIPACVQQAHATAQAILQS
jgi:protoporphyrinogen/coproporphyrinogen III oxidase